MKILDFSTPKALGDAMVQILKPQKSEKIYDGACGKLSLLLAIKNYIDHSSKQSDGYLLSNFYGCELHSETHHEALEIAKSHNIDISNIQNIDAIQNDFKSTQKYDVLISHPPFGVKIKKGFGELGIETDDLIHRFLQHYIHSLVDGGRAAIIVPNSFLFSASKPFVTLRQALLEICDLHTVLGLPAKTFPYAAIKSSVLFFTKGRSTESIKYYAKGINEDYSVFLDFAINGIESERSFIYSIDNIDRETFWLPEAEYGIIEKEIKEKTKNFETFECYELEDVCLEINLTRDIFQDRKNALYLPKVGSLTSVTSVNQIIRNHNNYFQLVFDEAKILNEYMRYYFRSTLGQTCLLDCYEGITTPRISKASLTKKLKIYAPNVREQELISQTFETLSEVQVLMERMAVEFSSSPNSAKDLLDKLVQTKDVFNQLSMEERILRLIEAGENLKVEFKETLSKNIYTGKKDSALQMSVLKNIVGFLNKSGGELLIGVDDSGVIKGIENDLYKNNDKYKLQISTLINDNIGVKAAKYIKHNIYTIKSKKICLIQCSKSLEPVYLNGEFYVRTDPECRKLSTQEAYEYIRANF